MKSFSTKSWALMSAIAGTFGLMALTNAFLSRKAERDNLPGGDFIDVNGVRLHYVTRGEGQSVVLLHGNGSMIADFECSGILGGCAKNYRVIAFDRPGYGHSPRPAKAVTTPEEQADLIAAALLRLGIGDAVVMGHSWGTLVALQLAIRHGDRIRGLLLASGYYFPTLRIDAMLASAGAVPVLGALLNYTVIPLVARLSWRASIRNLFWPADVPETFRGFPREMGLRPSQLRTSAEEAGWMVPSTKGLANKCSKLSIPVALICGAGDQVVDPRHSARLSLRIAGSTITTLSFNGHMVHYTSGIELAKALADVVQKAGGCEVQPAPRAS